MKNYYKILGVDSQASEETIKRAYRKLSKKYHPDANPGDREAEQKFMEISEAYTVLLDQVKRKEYDRQLASIKKGPGTGEWNGKSGRAGTETGSGNFAYKDISGHFEQFFGFHPKTDETKGQGSDPKQKTKTNPIDMTEVFERYMGIKKK